MSRLLRLPVATGLVTTGLVGGFLLAQQTDSRAAGGVLFAAAGVAAVPRCWRAAGPWGTGAVAALYAVSLGAAHPLAKQIGTWPSVGTVTVVTAAAAYLIADRRRVVRAAPA